MGANLAWIALGVVAAFFAARRMETALALLIVSSAFRGVAAIRISGASIPLFEILLVVTLASWLVREIRARGHAGAPFGPLAWALLALPAAGLWSLPFSHGHLRTARYVGFLLLLTSFAWLLARFAAPKDLGRRLAGTFVLTAVGLAAIGVVQMVWPALGIGHHALIGRNTVSVLVRPAAFYLDPNFLGVHLAIGALVALALGADAERRDLKYVWFGSAIVCGAIVVATLSRTAWIAVATGVVVLAVSLPKGKKLAALVTLVMIGVTAIGLVQLVPMRLHVSESSKTRALMYSSSAEIIRDHPVFGVGLEAFQTVYPPYRRPGASTLILHPHQVPLALVAETGLAGVAAEALLAVATVITFVRRRRTGWDGYDAALLAAFVSLAVAAFFQFVLYFPVIWLIAGLSAAGTGPMRRPGGVSGADFAPAD